MNINSLQSATTPPPPTRAPNADGNDLKVARAVDLTLDLTRSSRNVLGAILGLNSDELQNFLAVTSELLKAGVVGREVVEVDGQPRETFIDARMADPTLRDAPPWRRENGLDLRA